MRDLNAREKTITGERKPTKTKKGEATVDPPKLREKKTDASNLWKDLSRECCRKKHCHKYALH